MSERKNAQITIESVKRQFDVFDALVYYGLERTKHPRTHQILCPFHDDKQKSARVYGDTSLLYCWSCQDAWDGIKFVATKEGISYTDAAFFLKKTFNLEIFDDIEIEEYGDDPVEATFKEIESKLSAKRSTWSAEIDRVEKLVKGCGKDLQNRVKLYLALDLIRKDPKFSGTQEGKDKLELLKRKCKGSHNG